MDQESGQNTGRNGWLLAGGMALLGIALALLLFGGAWLGRDLQTADLPQVPDFTTAEPGIATISQGALPLMAGDPAIDFTLNDLEGNRVTLSELRGRPVIVNFWATWCAPCRIEMPEFQQVYTAYQDAGLEILALNQLENPTAVQTFFIDEMGLTFTPLLDAEGSVSDAYGAFNLPSTYFIDADGVVSAVHRGPLTRQQLDDYLAEIIP